MFACVRHLCPGQGKEEKEEGPDELPTTSNEVVPCRVIESISEGEALRMIFASLCVEGSRGLGFLIHLGYWRISGY